MVFTTAYDQYAIEAFSVNSVDYLLKPIEPARLDRALDKLQRFTGDARPDVRALARSSPPTSHPAANSSASPRAWPIARSSSTWTG